MVRRERCGWTSRDAWRLEHGQTQGRRPSRGGRNMGKEWGTGGNAVDSPLLIAGHLLIEMLLAAVSAHELAGAGHLEALGGRLQMKCETATR